MSLHTDNQRLAHCDQTADADRQRCAVAMLGLWLVLIGGILTFAAVLMVFSVIRGGHPDVIEQGQKLLDPIWGGLGVIVLALGSGMMGMAFLCIRSRQPWALRLFLTLTLVCGTAFLAIRYIEGATMFPGISVRHVALSEDFVGRAFKPGDASIGRDLYLRSCMACHGLTGAGMPGLGKSLVASPFTAALPDVELVDFLIEGRDIDDPANTTGVPMPARGNNPTLTDQDLMDIVAHLRALDANGPSGAGTPTADSNSIPAIDPFALPYAKSFCRLYLLLSGLHSFYILVSMSVVGWSLSHAMRGHLGAFSPRSVTFGSVYWHATTAIAIILYLVLYLIR